MAVVVKLDVVLKDRGMSSKELARRLGISEVSISRFKTQKYRAVRFDTLNSMCEILKCKPGDILDFVED